MADRIIKGDSGNDVVIQNNDASRKIEVTNSGDVEITGDVKTTTVKATNLKANDGTAALVVADSTGRVTFSENNPVIQLGSNATFPNSHPSEITAYNYKLSSSDTYSNTTESFKAATRTSSSDSSVQSFAVNSGFTYIYQFEIQIDVERDSGTPTPRNGYIRLYDSATDLNQGDTASGTVLNECLVGRRLDSGGSNDARSTVHLCISCAVYYSSDDTRYVYLASKSTGTTVQIKTYQSSTYPANFYIYKIKGDITNAIT